MSSSENLYLENQLCFALYSASLAMGKTYQPLLKDLGLTYPQYLVMLVLWQYEAMSVSELGKLLYLDSGTLTPLLKRLEKSGLVTRTRSEEDERQVLVGLTPEGKVLKKKALQVPEKILCALDASVSEAKGLTKKLGELRANLIDHIETKKK